MFFGYYVAWQSPAVRQFYGGAEYLGFRVVESELGGPSWIYALQVIRALVPSPVCPARSDAPRGPWESALAMALFLSVWSTELLLPNPLMPSGWRTLISWDSRLGLVFGAFAGWLLSTPHGARGWDRYATPQKEPN